ncbi:MAG: hypothetical protein COV76_01535 [Candidatus Omnitrophica bacterium CG11_big_fil_rev_8_21_14_0_20_64_10]|nr:MAG: hypothetical protein COV76_01535 [Candidatus Omnitrophica bacterium CG11_big_fil_rev_8_21_14_0_20_64_10]
MLRSLLLGLLLLLPVSLHRFPGNILPADGFAIGLIAAAALGKLPRRRWSRLDALVGLYLLGGLISFWNSDNRAASALELAKQLYLAALYGAFSVIGRDPRFRERILPWMTGVGLAVSVIALGATAVYAVSGRYLYAIGNPWPVPYLGEVFRAKGTFYTHEYFGNYLTFVLPVWLGLSRFGPRAHFWRWTLPIGAAALIGTFSHAWAGWFTAGLLFLWPFLQERNRWFKPAGVAVTIGVILAIQAVSWVLIREVRIERSFRPDLPAPTDQYSFQDPRRGAEQLSVGIAYNWISYGLLKRFSLETFAQHPWIGRGLNRFHEVTQSAFDAGRIHHPYERIDPHSMLLGRLAETGGIGTGFLILLWIGLLGAAAGRPTRAGPEETFLWMRRALWAANIGLLVNSLHVDIMNFRFLWIGFGLLAAWQIPPREDHEHPAA